MSKLPLCFILVDAEFCAQPVDDAACLHASVALDMSAVPDHRQPGFIRNGRIIRRRSVQRVPEFFQPFAGQPCFLRERQHFKLCFIHAGPVELPLLGQIEHNGQFFFPPVWVPAQQLQKRRFLLPPLIEVRLHTVRRKGQPVLIHDVVKRLCDMIHVFSPFYGSGSAAALPLRFCYAASIRSSVSTSTSSRPARSPV